MKRIYETSAAKSLKAYVILSRGGKLVARVLAHYGDSVCRVEVNDEKSDAMQVGSARGGGYDKFTAALSGLTIDGHVMSDHCGERAKPPRGLNYFPSDYKPRPGYSLANWQEYDRATGESRSGYYWRERAEAELGEGAAWDDVKARAIELKAAADLVGGYSSCFRDSGLDYLTARGYRVLQVI